MSDAVRSLRPGPVAGHYPERFFEPLPYLDRIAQEAGGALRQLYAARPSGYWRAVRRIDRRGEAFKTLSDAELSARAAALRGPLRIHGFRADLVEESFAVIRELSSRVLGMRHFPVQLIGGLVLLDGRIAEMQTGEGKSLTATLAAATAALAGVPTHVITVNEYLVGRDAEIMGPLYSALGLTLGSVTVDMAPGAKRDAYRADIVYCTNKQVVFDYLRDRLTLEGAPSPLRARLESIYSEQPRFDRVMLRGLCFGIVDEADSVLIDEARTPLIIAQDAQDLEAAQTLYREALSFADALLPGKDYVHRVEDRQVDLTDAGKGRLEQFGASAGGLWRGRLRREDLVTMALTARHVFRRDHDYLVKDDKVHIIDEFTGRLMSDRSWEQGLHQLIETKEGVPLTGQQTTRARISYQNFFRRYLRLAGMTGTAADVRGELWAVYRLGVVAVPTNRPSRRRIARDRVHLTAKEKWAAVAAASAAAQRGGRAVLIGTRSVAASEQASQCLTEAGLKHRVLNARQDREEAETIAEAGKSGTVTVATNMAGRGTDILLDQPVAEAGGLHVIMTERHEARRIDRQLAGRCGRQGDPGRVEAHLSLEDELLGKFAPRHYLVVLRSLSRVLNSVPSGPGRLLAHAAQRRAERHSARIRRSVLRIDERLGDLLAFSGRPE
jgi:preprotein translocase subunit SecA